MKLLTCVCLIFIFVILTLQWIVHGKECSSLQYVTMGSEGIIQCAFSEDVDSVLWYNTTDYLKFKAIITLQNRIKSGSGFDSGEFDIELNGSLIIHNVFLKHEGTYTVIKLDSPTSRPVTYVISVLVLAETFNRHPTIKTCGIDRSVCFQTFQPNREIACTIQDARQAILLNWLVRTVDGDQNISSPLVITNDTHGYFTSLVTVTYPFAYSKILVVLVCKADGPPGLLKKNESLVLLQNSEKTLADVTPKWMFVEKNSRVQLNCSNNKMLYFVWQVNHSPEDSLETIVYMVEKNLKYVTEKDFKLHQTSLIIDEIAVDDAGTYRCISGDGYEDEVIAYDLQVFVYPEPGYVAVDGCDYQQYCVLQVQHQGSLTCSLKKIYPQVDLHISQVNKDASNYLTFYDKTVTRTTNGDTFDVIVETKYRYSGAAWYRQTVKCEVVGVDIETLHLSTTFELLFVHGAIPTTDTYIPADGPSYWVIAVVLGCGLVFFAVIGLLLIKVRGRNVLLRTRGYKEPEVTYAVDDLNGTGAEERYKTRELIDRREVTPLVSNFAPSANKDIFILELKAKYQDLYDAVQPIPYIRDRLYCVDRVFVEGGIEYLVAKDKIGGQRTWGKLSSYHNILDDDRVKSVRSIIEGEPGYGKSTLTLQLSYDWCNKILKDIDILILLRLRQLGGVASVYKAIKQFLLPKDSKLTETDIADIISECSSVLVILDGYDEYPDQDGDVDSDVISIIMRKMFQQFQVILTTRSSYLPKKYPGMTKRLKLTGFDDHARNQYIRKAVVGDDVKAAEKIKQRLKENPVLGDLCQVPLFFVMFAHMSHESKQFQKFNSVTSFFRYMISCFHSHMKNKMEDDNVQKYDLFETEHKELDKLAFEGLSRKDQQIVWNKQYMCERLGQDFYDQYVRIGILVEEEVLDISDDSNAVITEHIQYKTEVRFYHKLFCEWYAAHHLSEYGSKDAVTFDPWKGSEPESEISDFEENSLNNYQEKDIYYGSYFESQEDHYLKYLDPFDLQYVYRFACGLNRVAAGKIIENLKTRRGGEKFAILCILEKSGKVEDVLEDVEYLCSLQININEGDSLLLQRSTIQLLEIATAKEISISCVYLYKCYSTVDLRGGNHLQLKSNLSIPVLTTLNTLLIDTIGEGREITSEEFTGILQYSSKCLALKKLGLYSCLLPPSVQAESVSVLRSRNVEVTWYPSYGSTVYQLNLQSCRWEHKYGAGKVMSDEEYQSVMNNFRRPWKKS